MPNTAKLRQRDRVLEYVTREGIFKMNNRSELTYTNTAFLRLFGYTSVEEFNTLRRGIFGTEEDEIFVRTTLSTGESVSDRRILFKTRYNGNFWGLLSCTAENNDSWVGAIIDITVLVENEHTIRLSANALAKSNMELDRFIYSASHDIRSPISTVMGLVNLIKLETDQARQMELIGMISLTMTKLDTFLHQLSSHSKNGRRDLNVSPIDLPNLIAGVLKQLSNHTYYGDVNIATNATIDQEFFSDRERLEAILYDILKNGLDFIDMSKTRKDIDIHAQVTRNKLIIEIFDNGIGISETRVSNVFDLFYKGSSQSRGAGLGLYLVRETMTRLGGVVTLHSRLGIGTLVRLEIPNAQSQY